MQSAWALVKTWSRLGPGPLQIIGIDCKSYSDPCANVTTHHPANLIVQVHFCAAYCSLIVWLLHFIVAFLSWITHSIRPHVSAMGLEYASIIAALVLRNLLVTFEVARSGTGELIAPQYFAAIFVYNIFFHPLAGYHGPLLRRAFRFPFIKVMVSGALPHRVKNIHDQYGEVVRVAPNEFSFTNPASWQEDHTQMKRSRLTQWWLWLAEASQSQWFSQALSIKWYDRHPNFNYSWTRFGQVFRPLMPYYPGRYETTDCCGWCYWSRSLPPWRHGCLSSTMGSIPIPRKLSSPHKLYPWWLPDSLRCISPLFAWAP